jgi:hypothetical protein
VSIARWRDAAALDDAFAEHIAAARAAASVDVDANPWTA